MKSNHLRALAAVAGALLITNMTSLKASTHDDRIESSFTKTEIYKDNLQKDDINISSNNGNVVLSGTAANASHKMLAGDAAKSLRGVQSVDNRIRVADGCSDEWSRSGQCSDQTTYPGGVPKSLFLSGEEPFVSSNGNTRRPVARRGPIDHYQTQSDRAITESIRGAIYDDPSLDGVYNDITIRTIKGHVTLNGTVDTISARNEIQAKARETVKNNMIHNKIMVTRT